MFPRNSIWTTSTECIKISDSHTTNAIQETNIASLVTNNEQKKENISSISIYSPAVWQIYWGDEIIIETDTDLA